MVDFVNEFCKNNVFKRLCDRDT